MTPEERLRTLENCYSTLLSQGKIHNKQDYADYIGTSRTSLSSAFGGNEKYLTDNLVSKAVAATNRTCDVVAKGEIYVIPTGARGGTLGDFAESVKAYDCERMVSPIKGADYAMQVTGDSMSPEYPSGSQILIKKIDERAFIEWGKVYVLDTDNGAVIKQIRRTENADEVECVSLNPAYQSFRIGTKFIHGWYRVLMVMSLK